MIFTEAHPGLHTVVAVRQMVQYRLGKRCRVAKIKTVIATKYIVYIFKDFK